MIELGKIVIHKNLIRKYKVIDRTMILEEPVLICIREGTNVSKQRVYLFEQYCKEVSRREYSDRGVI